MSARLVMFGLIACVSSSAALSANGDELYPASVVRGGADESRSSAARTLFDHHDRQIVMTTFPSFGKVSAVYVAELAHPDGTIRRRVFAREAVEDAWDGWLLKNMQVSKAEAPIDDATFVLLRELWATALTGVTHERPEIPFDGVWFLFEDRSLAGYAFTPTSGTKAQALADVGTMLFQYAFSPERDRARRLAVLRDNARATRVLLGLSPDPARPPSRPMEPIR